MSGAEIRQATSGQWWLHYQDDYGTPRTSGPYCHEAEALGAAHRLLPDGSAVEVPRTVTLHVPQRRRQGRITA